MRLELVALTTDGKEYCRERNVSLIPSEDAGKPNTVITGARFELYGDETEIRVYPVEDPYPALVVDEHR